ncbi:MAG: DUF3144 domain-containing protein [Phenylobacterium sp.]|uniref:DUF3144 domain-containing protein n=1 Tax=Phenylobacterium sp. TaxID=1871053 RepID=UPI00120D9FD8|nr:DUF3144 domain-containing protein [Phenylobacterium sp.]TAL38143.1 MAG: DUF3144 domain-containing protein [Phenylobacterium sp.]
MSELDPEFYDRADAHIHLSNEQANKIDPGKVSASMMFAAARFNAWLSAKGFESGDQMQEAREDLVSYFCDQYRAMLEHHLDEYADNFDSFMGAK